MNKEQKEIMKKVNKAFSELYVLSNITWTPYRDVLFKMNKKDEKQHRFGNWSEYHKGAASINDCAKLFTVKHIAESLFNKDKYKVDDLNVGTDLFAGYHLYAIAWMPNSISYYVDNRLISTTTPSNLGGLWVFNSKFFLILNNAVNAGFSGSWQNLQSSTMSIDWVRSYQLNGYGEVFGP